MWICNLITSADKYSQSVTLKAQGGNSNFKTAFGGALSIINYLCFAASIVFFVDKFLQRNNMVIKASTKEVVDSQILDFHKYPFAFLVAPNSDPVPDLLRYLRFEVRYKGYLRNSTDNSTYTFSYFYNTTLCDINNPLHINPDFKDLVTNGREDISSFYCVDYQKKDKVDLYGVYGDSNLNGYLTFYARPCSNTTDGNCKTPNEIVDFASQLKFYYRTISHEIENSNLNPAIPLFFGDKLRGNDVMQTNYFVSFQNIEYSSDEGFIFEGINNYDFFRVDSSSYRSEVGGFNKSLKYMEGFYFIKVYLTMSSTKQNISRIYEKLQNTLANIGGIINGLSIIALIINYNYGNSTYLIDIYNSLYELTSDQELLTTKKPEISISDSKISTVKRMTDQLVNAPSRKIFQIREQFNLNNFKRFLPIFCQTGQDKVMLKKIKTIVDENLNIKKILNDLLQCKSSLKPQLAVGTQEKAGDTKPKKFDEEPQKLAERKTQIRYNNFAHL